MDKHVCKLCNRRFSNGRALGGHMRSHVMASKHHPPPQQPNSPSSYSSSSFEADKRPCYGLRENPRKSVRLAGPEFSDYGPHGNSLSAVVQDRESETESAPGSPARDRLDARRLRPDEPEPVSSVSNTTPDEDVALCLVMLSRDVWSREDEAEEKPLTTRFLESDDDYENHDEPAPTPRSRRGSYRCETCKKTFGSYQALGGHRASHKKVRTHEDESPIVDVGSEVNNGSDAKIHECPFCPRVFPSGQALGGHKRSHLVNSASSSQPPIVAPAFERDRGSFIDLNLPAPMDETEDESQVEY